MEAVVPAEITAELTQILSNLVLGDNEIRSKYVLSFELFSPLSRRFLAFFVGVGQNNNERLAATPELYLLALAQFAIAADTEVVSYPFYQIVCSYELDSWAGSERSGGWGKNLTTSSPGLVYRLHTIRIHILSSSN
jgi:hypothetical protein